MGNLRTSLGGILANHTNIFESLSRHEKRVMSRHDDLRFTLSESIEDCSKVTSLWGMLIEFRLLAGENERRPGGIVGPGEFLQQCKQV